MTGPPTADALRGTSPLPALVLVWLTCLATGVSAWLWNDIDNDVTTRADDAGWDQGLLLPHQDLLWVTCNGAFLLSLIAALAMTRSAARTRRRRRDAAATTADAGQPQP